MRFRAFDRHGVAAFLLSLSSITHAAPLITEFMASNQSGITDEDGEFPDWIEIHNPDLTPVDLGGFHLSDDATVPTRWTFPAGTTLQPGGYLVVFASNKNRSTPGQPLHTNFSLSAAGESLLLSAPGGSPVLNSWTPFPPQTGDVSYGLLAPTSGALSSFFNTPTPGAPNNNANAPAERVVFNPPSRTFNSGTPLNVALAATSPTAVIRFTTNRSRPVGTNGVTGTFAAAAATDIGTWTNHPLKPNDMVRVTGPAPLTATVNYFVTVLGPDTFKLAIEPGGPPIDLTTSGNFTIRRDATLATAATTDVFTSSGNHGFFNGDPVQLSSTATLPGGTTAGTTYFVSILSTTTFRLSTSPTLTPIVDVTAAATGILTVFRTPSPVYTNPIPVTLNTRVRAQAFEEGRPPGPIVGEMYFALDTNAQNLTSPLPIVLSHTWNTAMADNVVVESQVMVFEPKAPDNLARLTNPPDLAAPCSIERRGSSTAGDPKYSVAIELQDENGIDRSLSPLGLPSDSDWVMHAPYQFDRSMMHNDLIYRLSNDAGRYAPRTKFVEHIHNVQSLTNTIEGSLTGTDYFGVYSFMEKITRGNDRVDVENLTIADNTAPTIQGGYMFKVDRLDAGETGIRPLAGQSFGNVGTMGPGNDIMAWVNPREISSDPFKVVTAAQSNWLRGHIGEAWATLSGPNFMDPVNGYAKYWDPAAMIDHHIINTATKNADGMRLSAHWHKPRFGRITAGPAWDFDRAQGSTDGRDFNWGTWRGDIGDLGTDFFHYPWYNEMFTDPNFWQQWIDRYHQLRMTSWSTAAIHARIDEFANTLNPGNAAGTPAKRSATRWAASAPRLATSNTAITNNTFNGQYTGEIAWLKHWWANRLTFMDNQFTRPATTSSPSGPVPTGTSITLTSPSTSTQGVRIYYTTDGTDPRPRATQPLTPSGGYITAGTFLNEINPVRAIVPTSATTGGAANQWRGADLNSNGNNTDDFDDSSWFANAPGTISGVGYDNSFAAGAVDFQPFFSLRWNTSTFSGANATPPGISPVSTSNVMFSGSINGTTYAGNQSCYLRLPFTLTEAQMALAIPGNRLVLQIRCDDGFVAWLNGTELTSARLNAPATTTLAFNSAATATNADGNAILYADYDISSALSALHLGQNILAIHALNSGLTSSDFLIGAKIAIQTPPPPFSPDLNPAATAYSDPIPITQPTQFFIRTLNPIRPSDPPTQSGGGIGSVPNGSSWSAPTIAFFFPGALPASQASLQISEVLYHPDSPTPTEITAGFTNSNDFEFIRLTNTGTTPVDLTGIFFSNGVQFSAPEGLQNWLPAGASTVVVENRAGFIARFGTTFSILGEYDGDLSDAGETVTLNDRSGTIISSFTYDDANGWPTAADNGYSLILTGANPALPASWIASLDPGGSGVASFTSWRSRYFSDASGAPDADPDADGLNNFGEYAFATDPRSPGTREAALATLIPGPPQAISIRRRSAAPDVSWSFESSTNPATGPWTIEAPNPESVTPGGDGTEAVTWRSTASDIPQRFLRAKAAAIP
jgi:hypothetical protein